MGRATHLLTQTITVAPYTGRSGFGGDPTFGTQVELPCREEKKLQIIRDTEGKEKQSNTTLVTETEIDERSRVWLTGANTSDDNAASRVIGRGSAPIPGDGYTLYETFF